jgi:uncharacterized protein YndB with AHSA1/START domain
MTSLRNTISIDASPERVWEVLGDLAATPEWLPGTVAAEVEGSTRVCTMADGSEVREEISDYSSERRTFRYRHLQVPLPVKDSSGTFSVEPAGEGGAVVALESEFEPLDPATEPDVRAMFDGALKQSLASLRRRVEQGARWDAA